MRDRLIKWVATGFGTGLIPKASGTFGSVLGVGLWWLIASAHEAWVWIAYPLVAIPLAVWVAGEAAKRMLESDPPSVVIDEIVAMPIALAGMDLVVWKICVGFAAFRLFDIWKPIPVRQSQVLPGGLGIVVDDVLAAGYACALTHAIVWGVNLVQH